MAKQARAYRPEISDLAVITKTGKSWREWFAALDKARAAKLGHKAITKLLAETRQIGPWWQQMVAVEYERARGLRAKHQTGSGFSVSVSKTLPCELAELYAATADARRRKKWFPPGEVKISSLTENKYFRASRNGEARLEINFYAKPGGKVQISVQVGKLPKKSDVERERAAWKKALAKLQILLDV
jgi:hypothetical protein